MQEKKCTECCEVKPLSDFGVLKRGLYGRRSKCRACIRKQTKKWYAKKVIADPVWRAKSIAASRKWQKENPEKRSAIAIRRNKKEMLVAPEKVRARALVNQKVRFGRMPRASDLSCEYCGEKAKHYHHHKGYAFEHRYDVVPVCFSCHKNVG